MSRPYVCTCQCMPPSTELAMTRVQASEIPVSGTVPCTYPKWADLGKMRGNGEKWGKFWMLDGKMGEFRG